MDTIHAAIRDVFRAHGVEWTDTAAVGHGLPDAIVCWQGRLALLEIKSGAAANKRKGKTADAQRLFAARFPERRVTSLQDADATIRWLKASTS
jgi:hypothetical protein